MNCLEKNNIFKFPTFNSFHASCRPQIFSIPESMAYYLAKNSASIKIYQKLAQSCKYFFIRNPIIFAGIFSVDAEKCLIENNFCRCCTPTEFNFDASKQKMPKIWITEGLALYLSLVAKDLSLQPPILKISEVIPKLYKCDATSLSISKQILSFKEFLFLSSNVNSCHFDRVCILSEDGSIIPLEKIIANLPKIETYEEQMKDDTNNSMYISSDTVRKLLKLPHLHNLKHLQLWDLSETFDIKAFYGFLKKKSIKTFLTFISPISDPFKNILDNIIDDLISMPDFTQICIYYPRENRKKAIILGSRIYPEMKRWL